MTRYFALFCGIVFTLAGILGFVPGFTPAAAHDAPALTVSAGYGYLLGLFPINVLHNLVHLSIGGLGFATARTFSATRAFSRGLAIFLGALTVMGLVPALYTTFGLVPLYGHDVWLHGLEAVAAAYFGFIAPTTRTRFSGPRRAS